LLQISLISFSGGLPVKTAGTHARTGGAGLDFQIFPKYQRSFKAPLAPAFHGKGEPLIDPNNRRSESRPPLDPAKKERYKKRSEVEWANSILKDWLLLEKLYVKGHAKVSFMLFATVLCLAALRMIQYFII
jgi:hypothetical protein